MQKLLCALLASTARAGELFLANKPTLDQDLINTKINIDIDADSIVACQYITQTSVFNFGNVLNPGVTALKHQTEQLETYVFPDQSTAYFNFCEKAYKVAGDTCDAPSESNAFIKNTVEVASQTCQGLNTQNDTNVGDTAGFEIMDSSGQVKGISLIYKGGACPYSTTNEPYRLNVTSMCPSDGKDSQILPSVVSNQTIHNGCNYTIVYETPNGCAVFSLSQVTRFFYKYYYLFGAVLIASGVVLAFFGNKIVNIVIGMVSTFALVIILSTLFINLALDKVDKEWVVWTAFVVIFLVSLGIGLLLVKFRKYGLAIFAGWGGVMIGFVVTTTFAVGNVYAFYAIIIAAAIGMFFITLKIEETVTILLTAFIGAYALVRGISLYAGGFPSESELHDEVEAGIVTLETMPKSYYYYLAGILLVFIGSSIYQFKSNKAKVKQTHIDKVFMK